MPVRTLTPRFDDSGRLLELKVSRERTLTSQLIGRMTLSSFRSVAVQRPQLARGLTPPRLNTVSKYDRALLQLRSKQAPLEKYIFMQQLKDADEALFYRLTVECLSVSGK